MDECLTIPFVPEFSGCLVETPSCHFAVRCGFSYHCHHPNHRDFHSTISTAGERIDLAKRYRALKEARRLKYLAELAKADLPPHLEPQVGYLATPKG